MLDQPYPVSVTVTDGQGGSTTLDTTVTVSELDDLTLRLGPAVTTISQGTDGFTYAFVDAPDGSPNVPVELSAENVPERVAGDHAHGDGADRQWLRGARYGYRAGTPDDTYTLDVVATSGTVTKRATLTVTTTFALIPQCEATIAGVVTDQSTARRWRTRVSTSAG